MINHFGYGVGGQPGDYSSHCDAERYVQRNGYVLVCGFGFGGPCGGYLLDSGDIDCEWRCCDVQRGARNDSACVREWADGDSRRFAVAYIVGAGSRWSADASDRTKPPIGQVCCARGGTAAVADRGLFAGHWVLDHYQPAWNAGRQLYVRRRPPRVDQQFIRRR